MGIKNVVEGIEVVVEVVVDFFVEGSSLFVSVGCGLLLLRMVMMQQVF